MRIAAAGLFVLMASAPVLAQSEPVFGAGVMASKCSRLTEAVPEWVDPGQNALAFSMLSWTEGYITGTNMELEAAGEDGFDMDSRTSMELWSAIYGYCARNPDAIAVQAAIEAMVTLERRPFN